MSDEIIKSPFTLGLKRHIYEAFGKHTVRSKGIDGLAQEPVSFEIRKNETLVGCVVV